MGFPEEIKRIRQRCFLTQHDFAKEVQERAIYVGYGRERRCEACG